MSSDNNRPATTSNSPPDTNTATDTATADETGFPTSNENTLTKATRLARQVYNNEYAAFIIDSVAIGTLAFISAITFFTSIAALGNFTGTFLTPYSLFLGVGAILAYRRRFHTDDTEPDN